MTTQHMHALSSKELVECYLSFFRTRGHLEMSGSSLVLPGNSTSFVIAGMQPWLPYLRGERIPPATRLTSVQRCLRSDDMDAVGTNMRKNSAFHMLGNWSVGDYGKQEAIALAYEFLLSGLHLDPKNIYVSVFAGDSEMCLLPDDEAVAGWLSQGVQRDHIVPLGTEDNFWTMTGGIGPCGPCTEIYIDRGIVYGCGKENCLPGCSCERFLEIWNLVFMQFERLQNGSLIPLPLRSIDTGMGVERTGTILQGAESVFSIDLFQPALHLLEDLVPSGSVGGEESETRARRVILDHTRAALFAILAGATPGRDGRNSIVRRLIRRAARQGRVLGIEQPFLGELVPRLVEGHAGLLTPEEEGQTAQVVQILTGEEQLFSRVLTTGLRYLAGLEPDRAGIVEGRHLFRLHAEKGFPPDLAAEILAERGLSIDWSSYIQAQEEHRVVSRVSAERHFHGV